MPIFRFKVFFSKKDTDINILSYSTVWIKKTIRDENKREYLEGETAKVADKNIERLAEKLKMLCNKFEDSLEVVALHTEGAPHTDEYDRLESKLQKLPKFRTFDKKMDNTFEKRMN